MVITLKKGRANAYIRDKTLCQSFLTFGSLYAKKAEFLAPLRGDFDYLPPMDIFLM